MLYAELEFITHKHHLQSFIYIFFIFLLDWETIPNVNFMTNYVKFKSINEQTEKAK